jgi:hypothetical protein
MQYSAHRKCSRNRGDHSDFTRAREIYVKGARRDNDRKSCDENMRNPEGAPESGAPYWIETFARLSSFSRPYRGYAGARGSPSHKRSLKRFRDREGVKV